MTPRAYRDQRPTRDYRIIRIDRTKPKRGQADSRFWRAFPQNIFYDGRLKNEVHQR
jgi:hypothetical protein